jgi:branched-chain amino acid transport system permease protein
VEHFLGFALIGVPYGCSYAIMAVGLVLTYQATGVFNFAFGAQAYTSAVFFTWLTTVVNWPVWAAFLVSVVLIGPVLGLLFDRFLFSRIPNANTTAKIVTGICMFVGIPSVLGIFFGKDNLGGAPSIIISINKVLFTWFGQPVNGAFVSTVIVTVVTLVAVVILIRFTPLGLQMRGAVESRRLVQLDGVNAQGVVAVAWAVSGFFAALAGVLFAPNFGELQPDYYAALMVAAIAAAAWGVMKSMPIATLVAVLMGVLTTLLEGYLPTTGIWFSAVLPALPFLVLVVALLVVPGMRRLEANADPLASVDPPLPPTTASTRHRTMDRIIRLLFYALLAVFIVSMLTWIPVTWKGVFDEGLALSVIFLSLTMITGMAGQLSLCQATFAGIGAVMAAQLAMHLHLNMLVGGLVGAAVGAACAVVLATLSLRLKGLGLALMTLAFALLFDNTFFAQSSIAGGQQGIAVKQSWYAPFDFFNAKGITNQFFIMAMVVLVVCVILVLLVRNGTTGHFLAAMRGSETGAAGLGINLTWEKIMVFSMAGALAAIGGTLLSIQQQVINPINFSYEISLAFVVVVITTGVSTVEGALQAGIGFAVFGQLLGYLPSWTGRANLLFPLFAVGALTYAKHPEGILEFQKRRNTERFEKIFFGPKDDALSELAANGDSTGSSHG